MAGVSYRQLAEILSPLPYDIAGQEDTDLADPAEPSADGELAYTPGQKPPRPSHCPQRPSLRQAAGHGPPARPGVSTDPRPQRHPPHEPEGGRELDHVRLPGVRGQEPRPDAAGDTPGVLRGVRMPVPGGGLVPLHPAHGQGGGVVRTEGGTRRGGGRLCVRRQARSTPAQLRPQ